MLNRKMRGIADPYTLGMIIALLGAVIIDRLHGDADQPSSATDAMSMQRVVQVEEAQGSVEQ